MSGQGAAATGAATAFEVKQKEEEARKEVCRVFFKKLEKLDLLEEVTPEETKSDEPAAAEHHGLQRESSFASNVTGMTGRTGFPRLMP